MQQNLPGEAGKIAIMATTKNINTPKLQQPNNCQY
jgi:hypothetical protein